MNSPRLVIVARRFWPLIGGAEVMIGRLAAEFHARGAQVTVLTPHWQADGPRRFDHGGIDVVRIAPPAGGWWSTAQYIGRIERWLRAAGEIDLAYVLGLRHEAYATLGAAKKAGFPVVLSPERAGLDGDCHWQIEAACGRRIKHRCYRAAAFVAPSPLLHRELIAAGYPRNRIHPIIKSVPLLPPRGVDDQRQARRAVAESDPRLAAEPDALVAVSSGPLEPGHGLELLVDAFAKVVAARPTARLWLLGDGSLRPEWLDRVMWRRVADAIVLPGAYDDISDFLRAADVYAHPAQDDDISLSVLEAMAAGLPILVADTLFNRGYIDERAGRFVPPADAAALADGLLALAESREEAAKLGAHGRRTIEQRFLLDRAVDEHLALFAQLSPNFSNLAPRGAAPLPPEERDPASTGR